MPELRWAIICEKAIIEAQTNSVSLISIVENVTAPQLPPDFEQTIDKAKPPFIPYDFFVVQFWNRGKKNAPERFLARSLLLRPDGKGYGEAIQQIDLESAENAVIASRSVGFPFAGFGKYTVKIQFKTGKSWRTVKTIGFNLVRHPLLIKPTAH